ncbi:DUF167 domain-containing protein [Amaricoccus sp.]|uniref:DUF167 domain-containing protein n=1 Tax=Amaricoccus sp. TaxID=1872485 RepID=UPI001B600A7F|nr:DUF167 domain-containing protein [Amaricoccus sp.]MBP7243559.1 DUF167 domain-containing protein [Amaricoccus sp.]
MSAGLPWRDVPGGVELAVRLTPRGGAARVEGVADDAGGPCLRVRVPAPPVDGAANAALVAFLAEALRLPRRDVALVAGERSRVKRIRLTGEGLGPRLAALAGTG